MSVGREQMFSNQLHQWHKKFHPTFWSPLGPHLWINEKKKLTQLLVRSLKDTTCYKGAEISWILVFSKKKKEKQLKYLKLTVFCKVNIKNQMKLYTCIIYKYPIISQSLRLQLKHKEKNNIISPGLSVCMKYKSEK